MLLWSVFALLSAGVLAVLLRPLMGAAGDAASTAEGTAAVYRDQLTELESEQQRGLIGADEAEAARREIARRLLASVPTETSPDRPPTERDAATAPDQPQPPPLARRLATVLGVLLPVAAIGIYLASGTPGLPSQPVAARRALPPLSPDVAKLVTAVEARLKQNPEDGRGWDVIAPVYLRLTRYPAAADAYTRAARLLGDSPARLAGLAEATMLANDGRITEVTRTALEKLLRLDPNNVQARFWLAFGKEQDGRLAEAAAEYEQLLAIAPPDASWRETLAERHEAVRLALAETAAAPTTPLPQLPRLPPPSSPTVAAVPGPTQADIAAAERLSASERQAMIDGMVSGLAARLEQDGRDLAGWQRLIRALSTLGRRDDAIAALGRARKSFDGQPQQLAELAELARSLGLGS